MNSWDSLRLHRKPPHNLVYMAEVSQELKKERGSSLKITKGTNLQPCGPPAPDLPEKTVISLIITMNKGII